MQPTKLEFIYEEWKKTIEEIEDSGMTLDLLEDLILQLMQFFTGNECFSENSHEIRERSLPRVVDYANRYGLTRDTKDSLELARVFTRIEAAPNIMFMDLWDEPEFTEFGEKLLEVKMALDRNHKITADSQTSAVSQIVIVKFQEKLQDIEAILKKNHDVLTDIYEVAANNQASSQSPKRRYAPEVEEVIRLFKFYPEDHSKDSLPTEVFYDGNALNLSPYAVSVLYRLIVNFGYPVSYKNLAPDYPHKQAAPVLKGGISKIRKALAGHNVPVKISNKRQSAYWIHIEK